DEDILESMQWSWQTGLIGENGADADSGLVISATIPTKIINSVYLLNFILDNKPAFPNAPASGFQSATEMLSWVNAHLVSLGSWYITSGQLVCYLTQGIAKTASLEVLQKTMITVKNTIPYLDTDEYYHLSLTLDGVVATPAFPGDINNPGSLLQWLQSN